MKTGDRIFSYIVERELGEGGMGTVFLGRHTVLNQQVAIKALSPLLSRDQALRERFIQEANIQAGLRHPGIVQVLTAEMEGEQPSLVMEYIDGKSLSQVLELRGVLPVDDAVKIMEQVLSAVGYAHRQGVIHRDLKPSNVMVMANGDAKVTDFGIAKVLGSTKLTRTGTAMGSAHYMSPEQIRRPEAVDARSDIYSLGCVFYEVLTGRPPFGEKDAAGTESDFEIKIAHTNEVASGLNGFNKNIPVWLEHLVMSMLEKEPDQRPSNCEEILSQIRQSGEPLTTEKKNKTVVIKDKSVYRDEVKSTHAPTSGRKVSNQSSLSLIFSVFGIGFIALAWFFLYPTKKNSLPQLKSGAEVYKTVCAACHDTGAANAPKIGDFAAWSERLTKGYDTLLSHTINGFYAMPAKGGLPELHDIEVARAVVYLANASGADFDDPQGSK